MPVVVESVRVLPPRSHAPVPGQVSCAFEDGRVTLVVGSPGAGKSSLLRAAAGVWPLAEGSVRYNQTPLWHNGGKRLDEAVQRQIGYVFQQPEDQLFARTVKDEFLYSLRPYDFTLTEVEARITALLSDFQLDPVILEESPLHLSAGQRRKVAIAATVVTDATWLWFDEPTAGLDPLSVESFVTLVQTLASRRRELNQGGVVIATHDLDWFFPIADDLVILEGGSALWAGSVEESLRGMKVWENAGVGQPHRVALAEALHARGWHDIPVLADPETCAQVIAAGIPMESRDNASISTQRTALAAAAPEEPQTADMSVQPKPSQGSAPKWTQGWLDAFDPRAKWVFVVLASVSALVQTTWLGIALVALPTAVFAMSAGLSLRRAFQALRPLLWVAAASGVVSGLRFGNAYGHGHGPVLWHIGPVGYAFQAASLTLAQMAKVMVVVVLGTLLSTTTSTLAMKRGLERGLAPLARVGLPVGAFALAAALMLRFIPLIFRETDRFALIARVRGKYPSRGNSLRLRDMPPLLVPLLLSVLRLGEDVALAIEARGYGRDQMLSRRYAVERKSLRTVEWGLIGLGLLWLVTYLVVGHVLQS